MKLRELAKRALTDAAFFSGFAWVSLWLRFRRRATVLMYHRVLPEGDAVDSFSSDSIVVTRRTFERHVRFLRRFCNPLGAAEFAAVLRGERPWPPRACVITFDDGWYDNHEHALPVLERHSVPAVVFVATGYVGTASTFWQEELARLLYTAWRLGPASRELFARFGAEHVADLPAAAARDAVRELIGGIKAGAAAPIEGHLTEAREWLRARNLAVHGHGDDRFMTWADASRLASSPVVSVESHAHSHVPLTWIAVDEVRHELARSRASLSERLGVRTRFLAYPNGDHDDNVVAAARDAGFELAFTTNSGVVLPGDDPLRLRRINFGERGTATTRGFLCRLLGWW
jgi:peptidoglycan/xylan/chitin deacetylase (PgdA/CDA1 family)